ncbi:MAG: COX15/CtaA family protein [Candidatus Marinimicrobia bacterium]|nr:COX15/CtaA family protein [Candidatus Neomarinimicrobiota bacterium]MCF7829785.1 COX15/CtaA family protein [Candidatus Neomarinimicrobiota bacterium]MCF7881782.1 COX15/CtaA family protein [Candidatus Neomarinimicrobiota bacterium]
MTNKIRRFRRVAVTSTIATYLLIFVGGLVRVSGAGLGCPDWPKCFGRWIPPTDASQLPASIDPALFNFTLAWIEYINRLVGVVIGLLILATAILAIKIFRDQKKILYPSMAAALLVAYQGWQGSQVVASALEPFMITIHMVVAFVIVSLMIYVSQQAYYLENPDAEAQSKYPEGAHNWIAWLWSAAILQIILGTQVRSAIAHAANRFPLMSDFGLLNQSDPLNYIHGLLGVAVAGATWFVADRLRKGSENPSPLVGYGWKIMVILVSAQIVIGGILIGFGLPDLLQLYHLWTASLFVGVLLILFSALRKKEYRYEQ